MLKKVFPLCLTALVSCAPPAPAEEFETRTLAAAGAKRTYHVHKPKNMTKPLPLVIVLHGGGGNGKGLKDTYGFRPFVVKGELVAVYPDAGPGGWLPEHVGFLDAVIDRVLEDERVDRDRVFITGASRGGIMTFIMSQKSKHKFAAAGTVIASHLKGLLDDYPLERPVDFAMIAGTADPLMPYAGGWGAMREPRAAGEPEARVVPVEEVAAALARMNGIAGGPKVSSLPDSDRADGCTNEVRLWADPKTKRRVMRVKVIGGGHVVPGGRQYLPERMIGPACRDFDHAEVMWEFFKSAGASRASGSLVDGAKPRALDAESEKALRERVAAMYSAMLAGDVAKCVELSDPRVVKDKGRDKAEQFFKVVNGLVKLARLGPNDRSIKSITSLDDGKAARVELEVGKPRRSMSVELWGRVDGVWYYRETLK